MRPEWVASRERRRVRFVASAGDPPGWRVGGARRSRASRAWEALFVMFAAAIKGVKAEAEAPRRGGFDKSRLGGFDKSRLGVRSKGAAAATLSQTRPKGVAKRPRPATANKHAFQVPLL